MKTTTYQHKGAKRPKRGHKPDYTYFVVFFALVSLILLLTAFIVYF